MCLAGGLSRRSLALIIKYYPVADQLKLELHFYFIHLFISVIYIYIYYLFLLYIYIYIYQLQLWSPRVTESYALFMNLVLLRSNSNGNCLKCFLLNIFH